MLTRLWRHKFWNYLSHQAIFFYTIKTSSQKSKYIENEKSFQDEKKAFFITFKGLSLKKINKSFSECESATLRHSIKAFTARQLSSFFKQPDEIFFILKPWFKNKNISPELDLQKIADKKFNESLKAILKWLQWDSNPQP